MEYEIKHNKEHYDSVYQPSAIRIELQSLEFTINDFIDEYSEHNLKEKTEEEKLQFLNQYDYIEAISKDISEHYDKYIAKREPVKEELPQKRKIHIIQNTAERLSNIGYRIKDMYNDFFHGDNPVFNFFKYALLIIFNPLIFFCAIAPVGNMIYYLYLMSHGVYVSFGYHVFTWAYSIIGGILCAKLQD